jgi:uncharacterized protein (TIGR03790 family)
VTAKTVIPRPESPFGQSPFREGISALFVGAFSICKSRAKCPGARRQGNAGRLLQIALAAAWCGLFASVADAGGGPENVLLVVNANSNSSKSIANHYIQLRQIPACNVLYIDWQGDIEWCSIAKFRQRLLTPVLKTIEARKLSHQIDYVIYSSDFPWRVEFHEYFPDRKPPSGVKPFASLTGATYLWRYTLAKSPALASLASNWYVPASDADNHSACQKLGDIESRGFDASYMWNADGTRIEDEKLGHQYFLSTMLGVTSGRGNTVDEVFSYLDRAASADGHRPRGTVYFMKNGDVRSRTRDACFDEVVAQLISLGVPAQVLPGKIPRGAKDIAGLMVGAAKFDFASAGDTILPGAICEHLTSTGGALKIDSAQTPLTDFLRFGAAGASGTVAEPYAIQAKFPLPSIHVHYARGCSLAESFYQSIAAPYELLIVGDPLCQPWAVFPQIGVDGVAPNQEVHGPLSITPTTSAKPGRTVKAFETFVDGRLVAQSTPGKTLTIDTTKLIDGYHELRVVGFANNAIETQGRAIVPFQVNNHGGSVELSLVPGDDALSSFAVRVVVRQPNAKQILVMNNGRKLGQVDGSEGEVQISAEDLGRGLVALQAVSNGEAAAASAPLLVHVR